MTRPTSGPGAWAAQNTEETPMATGRTLHDYAPLLEALQQLTATAPGLPATIVAPSFYRDETGYTDQHLSVHVDSEHDLLLWKSAVGGVREDASDLAGDARHHRVTTHVLDVAVDVVWIEDLPAAAVA